MDLERLRDYFVANGWVVSEACRGAELIVLSGCAFTEEMEKQTLSYVRSAKHVQQNGRPIVVTGCIAGILPERLAGMPSVLALKHADLHRLDALISATVPLASIPDPHVLDPGHLSCATAFGWPEHLAARVTYPREIPRYVSNCLVKMVSARSRADSAALQKRYHIRVAHGCNAKCSYCSIRLAAGELCSKPLPQIVREFQAGLAEGFEEFELVAEDIGGYGEDTGSSIVELLRALFAVEGDYRIGWMDFSPRWLVKYFDELLPVFKVHSGKIGSIGFPVQSGSDRILQGMAREHSAVEACRCLSTLRREAGLRHMSTHVMVGFPGETRGDFRKTLDFVRAVPFDVVVAHVFSPRPGTPAAAMKHQIAPCRKLARAWEVRLRWDWHRLRPARLAPA